MKSSSYQKTIKRVVKFEGVGLHTGIKTEVTLLPAESDTGIVFKKNNKLIPASIKYVKDLKRAVTLGKGKIKIMTVEHLLAGIFMAGIDNIIVELKGGNEIPAGDGSAFYFLKILKKAGIKKQKSKRKKLYIKKPVYLITQDKFIFVIPSDNFRITYYMDFPEKHLRNQVIDFPEINYKIFKKEIAPARTFGFYREVKDLFKKGLARGGSLDNAVVVTESGYLNKGLRFKDECIRHKVLDIIGDFALINRELYLHIIACKTGHKEDIEIIRKVLKNAESSR